MEFSIKTSHPEKAKGAIVVGVFADGNLSVAAQALDLATQGALARRIERREVCGKRGEIVTLFDPAGIACERLVLVGLGQQDAYDADAYLAACATAARALAQAHDESVQFLLPETLDESSLPADAEVTLPWRLRQAVISLLAATYAFDDYQSEKSRLAGPRQVIFSAPARSELAAAKAALTEGQAIAEGIALARDLGNRPGNVCTPDYLARTAEKLAEKEGLHCKILDQKDMEKLGMGALLAVAQGSKQPPRFIVLRWKGGDKGEAPLVLVGKGITFDSGGISLKPAADMDEMKYDMCGAASVLGALLIAARLQLPLNLIALIPTCENMPDGRAARPGDIVSSMSGQTIEIVNTDAEGRLILCDALAYAERFEPTAVIDVATLTGACIIALGHVASGLFSPEDALAHELEAAGRVSRDKVWRLPLWDDYQDSLKSPFADMKNSGGRPAGSITAACFLSRFAKRFPWAHLDIAGTAWKSGKDKGATGRPVTLLAHFLLARAKRL